LAHVILWQFRPRSGSEAAFEAAYGPAGDWASLFRKSEEYLGTELLRDRSDPSLYLTVDRWTSREAFEDFRRRHATEYESLDERCSALTEQEAPLGSYDTRDL
jgi:heme-degrading monooxygenase HmoA